MVAWISYRFESSQISSDSMEQYVSVVNRACETRGLVPTGKAPTGTRVCIELRKALDGFKIARLKAGGVEPVQHIPTPDLVNSGMCEFASVPLRLGLFSSPSQELLVARTGTILTANSPGAFCIVSLSLETTAYIFSLS
jgi:hypothetical protein